MHAELIKPIYDFKTKDVLRVFMEALERNGEIFESSQKEQSICHAEFHTNQATIRAALSAQKVVGE